MPYYLPDCVNPVQYAQVLYWYCSDCPRGQIQKEVGLKDKAFAKALKRFWDILWLAVTKNMAQEKLGGPGRFVAIDETFFVKKKAAKGGFRGRATAGNKTIVMGFLEVELESKKVTGNCVLIEIPDRAAATLKAKVKELVAARLAVEGELVEAFVAARLATIWQ